MRLIIWTNHRRYYRHANARQCEGREGCLGSALLTRKTMPDQTLFRRKSPKYATDKEVTEGWGSFLTLPLGANFDPRGEFCPMGVKFSVGPSFPLNSRECSPLGLNEGVNIPPWGQISPLGAKFTPRGEVHHWGPGVELRMALSFF
jgi:hypothetical protein